MFRKHGRTRFDLKRILKVCPPLFRLISCKYPVQEEAIPNFFNRLDGAPLALKHLQKGLFFRPHFSECRRVLHWLALAHYVFQFLYYYCNKNDIDLMDVSIVETIGWVTGIDRGFPISSFKYIFVVHPYRKMVK